MSFSESVCETDSARISYHIDFLDTIHGQNLSLQVHPLKEYIKAHFNMDYTQDESYYILDTDGDNSCVYLGVKTNVDKEEMAKALYSAQKGEKPFEAEKYVNKIPVKKHDHVLIPAGTVHCSGAGTMVLEISATPYYLPLRCGTGGVWILTESRVPYISSTDLPTYSGTGTRNL